MEVGTTLSAVQTLLANLQLPQLNEIINEFQLGDLQHILSSIIAVLRDAETKYEHSHGAQVWLKELKTIVSEASDLFDKFDALAEQKQLLKANKKRFRFLQAYTPRIGYKEMYQEAKEIKKKFEDSCKHCQLLFQPNHQPVKQRKVKTCSYVEAVNIVGREDDLEKVVGILLDSDVQHDVSFLSIVGMGGMGKTALAQLVYNDPRIMSAFSLRLWTCISDQDQKELDVKEILGKIMGRNNENYTTEWVQHQLRQQLSGNKYLLVLDDVWTEKHHQWHALVAFLKGGQRGSWVVVTTRSQETARVIGDGLMYKLQRLSEESSWHLFERMAFGSDQSTSPPDELVKIGREIVHICDQVPLAIREVGSLLHGLNRSEWLSFKENGFTSTRKGTQEIISIWKQSYDCLESPLKNCFRYCALFPKDFEIEKEMLISLWMAQDYIVPFYKGQTIEDAGEEYVSLFLKRSFFQDSKKNKSGEIVSFKMNNLMLDIAQNVANKEICTSTSLSDSVDEEIRHLSVVRGGHSKYSLGKTHIYSYLHVGKNGFKIEKVNNMFLNSLIENCKSLKALDLSGLMINRLPESLGELVHIRYLNLSDNIDLDVLPVSIAKLRFLQTIVLKRCRTLKGLPKDFVKLVNLRALDITSCFNITSMPRGISKLTCLHKLSDFVVDATNDNYSSRTQCFEAFLDLKPLSNLRGCLNVHIRWPKNPIMAVKEDDDQEGLFLKNKKHLNALNFHFIHEADGKVDNEEVRRIMDELEPHSNVKSLEVKKYHGLRMPGWIASLPNLVELQLANCRKLQYLPCLGNLIHLKVLKLIMLGELEYIGEDNPSDNSNSTLDPELFRVGRSSYLTCLETLELSSLPKLKAWRPRGTGDAHLFSRACSDKKTIPCFSQLKSLFLWNCPELSYIPFCPRVEDLKLVNFNDRLRIMENTGNFEELGNVASSSSSAPYSGGYSQHGTTRIKNVAISNVVWLGLLPMEAFRCLEKMDIWCDKEVESLKEAEQLFCSCSSSLKVLIIHNCCNLRSVVSGGLEHLIALTELQLRNCDNLNLSEEVVEENESEHRFSNHSLQIVTLQGLPQLVNLPNWLQLLPDLQTIAISLCSRLKSLPD